MILLPKLGEVRAPFYVAWVRIQPCQWPGCRFQPVDPHHVFRKSRGTLRDDSLAALCHKHHRKLHDTAKSELPFQEWDLAEALLARYWIEGPERDTKKLISLIMAAGPVPQR